MTIAPRRMLRRGVRRACESEMNCAQWPLPSAAGGRCGRRPPAPIRMVSDRARLPAHRDPTHRTARALDVIHAPTSCVHVHVHVCECRVRVDVVDAARRTRVASEVRVTLTLSAQAHGDTDRETAHICLETAVRRRATRPTAPRRNPKSTWTSDFRDGKCWPLVVGRVRGPRCNLHDP